LAKDQPTPAWKTATENATSALDARSVPQRRQFGEPPDTSTLLPSRAAEKLRALRDAWEELRTLTQSDVDLYQELLLDRGKAQQRYDSLTNYGASIRSGHGGDIYPEDHPSVVAARSELDKLNARLEALQKRRTNRKESFNAIGRLLRRCEAYVAESGTALTPFEMDPPKVPPGELPANAVERLRQRRRELLADLKEITTAPVHSSVVKAKVRAEVEELAERGCPDLYRMIEGGKDLRFPQVSETVPVDGFVRIEGAPFISARALVKVPDAIGLIARLFRDQLTAMLEAEVDASADDANALSDDERAEKSGAILDELLGVERLEEAFTELAAGAVIRRGDLDPRAFLDVEGPEPKGDHG
jgi:hypothetical protein